MPEEKALDEKPSEEEIQKIRQFTGENNSGTRIKLPFIRFNGEKGKYLKQILGEKDEQGKQSYLELGDSIKGVIIRVRRKADTDSRKGLGLYSFEFDHYGEELIMYDINTNKEYDRGGYSDLKKKYPNIRLHQILYVFMNGEMYKIGVKGTSLSPLWEYLGSFGRNDTVLRYETIFGAKDETNQAGDSFKVMTFTRGNETENWKQIWGELQQLNDEISSTAQKNVDLIGSQKQQEDVPVIQQEDEGQVTQQKDEEEEIDVRDIPF